MSPHYKCIECTGGMVWIVERGYGAPFVRLHGPDFRSHQCCLAVLVACIRACASAGLYCPQPICWDQDARRHAPVGLC